MSSASIVTIVSGLVALGTSAVVIASASRALIATLRALDDTARRTDLDRYQHTIEPLSCPTRCALGQFQGGLCNIGWIHVSGDRAFMLPMLRRRSPGRRNRARSAATPLAKTFTWSRVPCITRRRSAIR